MSWSVERYLSSLYLLIAIVCKIKERDVKNGRSGSESGGWQEYVRRSSAVVG